MERFKKALFPIIVFVIILILFLYRVSSCTAGNGDASKQSPSPSPSAAVSATASASPSASSVFPSVSGSPSPAVKYTNDDIIKLYKKAGFTVKEIRDAGNAAMVAYSSTDATGDTPLSFAWFDRMTGTRDVVASGLLADKFDITAQKSLLVLTTGKSYVNGKQWFPELYRSDFNDGTEAVRFMNETYPYFMPISKSFTVSDDRFESIRSLSIDFDAVSVGFMPQKGHEGEFEAAYRYIPKTSVVCSGGFCYVTFYNTTLSHDFSAPASGVGDGLRRFVSVKDDGANTLLTLQLGTKADRYNLSTSYSPDDAMPYAILRFKSNDGLSPVYPAGW